MGMIGYFAEIDSEKINQLLESTKKPLMDNIHDTLSGLRRLDIDKRWDFLHFGLTGTSAFDPAKNDPLSRAVLGATRESCAYGYCWVMVSGHPKKPPNMSAAF